MNKVLKILNAIVLELNDIKWIFKQMEDEEIAKINLKKLNRLYEDLQRISCDFNELFKKGEQRLNAKR